MENFDIRLSFDQLTLLTSSLSSCAAQCFHNGNVELGKRYHVLYDRLQNLIH